jgi:hypothetical protein
MKRTMIDWFDNAFKEQYNEQKKYHTVRAFHKHTHFPDLVQALQ